MRNYSVCLFGEKPNSFSVVLHIDSCTNDSSGKKKKANSNRQRLQSLKIKAGALKWTNPNPDCKQTANSTNF